MPRTFLPTSPHFVLPARLIRYARVGCISVGTVMIAYSLVLLVQRKIHLGTLLPLAIGAALTGHGIYWQRLQNWLRQRPTWRRLWQGVWFGFGVWLASFIGFCLVLNQHLHHTPAVGTARAIMVLGSGFKNGQPTPTLAARLDRAALLANQAPHALIVLTGGGSRGETQSEAEVMANYLHTRYGIAARRMALERQSTSTALNIANSLPILRAHGIMPTDPVVIVTSDFHTLRAQAIAQHQGLASVMMMDAPTPPVMRPAVWLREYFAFISGFLFKEF